ncbi:hypothetical protein Tco_1402540 [Tanacetum coccineum]
MNPEQARGIRICKRTVHSLLGVVGYRNKTEDTTPRYNNDNQSGQFGNQRTMTVVGARETVGSPCSATKMGYNAFNCKGFDTIPGNGSEAKAGIDEQELEAHYSYMAKIQEVSPEESSSTSQPLEQENKTVLKQLKKANASLTQELKECKTNLDETSRALGEATSSRDSCLSALQTKQTELEKYTALNDRLT